MSTPAADASDWLVGDSPIANLIRSKDWSVTPLGPISAWPESLRTAVSLILDSSFPLNLIWGPDAVQIWNEGYAVVCGDKHPGEFGTDYRTCWASAWPAIGPAFESARSGRTAFLENQPMFLDRLGYLEQTWFTFSLSPIRGPAGEVAGLFHPVIETTPQMLSERRTRALRDLASLAGTAKNRADAGTIAIEVLAEHLQDFPFLALYLGDERAATLIAQTGVEPGSPLAPAGIGLDGDGLAATYAQVLRDGQVVRLDDLGRRVGHLAAGPYPEPLTDVMLLPLVLAGDTRPTGVLVAAISTRLPFDEAFRSHVELVGAAVATALGNALVYERAQERAEALAQVDRAKTAFFSNVSHEMRTPLTLILGPLEDELDQVPDGESRERLQTAHRNALRMLRLVNSLLDFSRLEAGRMQATFVPTDLVAYTKDLASLFRSATERAGLTLEVTSDGLDEPVYVDRDMYEKILVNLLSNAFKHTFEGGIDVCLGRRADAIELVVADTGTGIPESELPALFNRFHRVRNARSRSFEGTGIGLALVQELARLHGGDVSVRSEEGRGSTFTVTLRRGKVGIPPEQIGHDPRDAVAGALATNRVDEALSWLGDGLVDATVQGDAATGAAGQRARVLLVDDNADMRDHVRRLLSREHEVSTAPDGQAALDLALADPPDLVLTDVMMPRLDGFGLLAALRADPRTSATPVIMLSARAGEDASSEGLLAGADDYLVKPFSTRELMARVSGTLSLSRIRRDFAGRLERASIAEDRARIARDLHDHVIQRLFAAALGLQSTLALLPDGRAAERVSDTVDALDDTISLIRGAIYRLNQVGSGEPVGFKERVIGIADDVASGLGFEPAVEFRGPVEHLELGAVADDAAAVLREALTNAAKHARASRVRVAVTAVDGVFTVQVTDDGVGLGDPTRSSGLANMAARAQQHGGTFSAEPATPTGTRVTWSVPAEV